MILIVPPKIEKCKVDDRPLLTHEDIEDAYLVQLEYVAICNISIDEQSNWVEKQKELYQRK